MRAEEKKEMIVLGVRVALSLSLSLLGFFYLNESNFPFWVNLVVMGLAYIVIAYDIIFRALKEIFKDRNPFNEYTLMSIASLGAFALRLFGPDHNEYLEGVLVMLLYQVGEFIGDYAEGKSRQAIVNAIDLRDQKAEVILPDGSLVSKSPEELQIGDVCLLKVGEKILCDATIIKGRGTIDESSLTGEFEPVDKKEGQEVLSGTILKNGSLQVQVQKAYADSTVAKLLALVENSSLKKSKADRFISKFAKYYTPIIMGLALLVAVVPPLFLGINDGAVWARYIFTSLCFLVIGCPCAIVISVPLAYFAGLGLASKHGVVVKGASYFDSLNSLKYILLDKTGTLTTGEMKIASLHPVNLSQEVFLEYLQAAESRSTHPIAKAVCAGADLGKLNREITDYQEISGYGIRAVYKGHTLLAGKLDFLNGKMIDLDPLKTPGSVTYLAVDNAYAGYVVLDDVLRPNCRSFIAKVQQKDLIPVLVSGDRIVNVKSLAAEVGIAESYGSLSPEDKTELVSEKIALKQGGVAFVGDGINDAPSIVRADVGFAMGGLGSDISVANADVVLMKDDLSKILTALEVAKKSRNRALVNIVVSLLVKTSVMVLSLIFPEFPLWAAVLADTGLTVVLVINSLLLTYAPIK